jgi:hypothetical protein
MAGTDFTPETQPQAERRLGLQPQQLQARKTASLPCRMHKGKENSLLIRLHALQFNN